MKKSPNLNRFIIKTILLKLIFFNGVIWSQTGGSEIYSEELNKLRALQGNSLSGLTLQGEELPRPEFREYYYNKFSELSEAFLTSRGLSEEGKTYLSIFAKTLAANALIGYRQEKGVDLRKLKPMLLPSLENSEKKMKQLIKKNKNAPSTYIGLLAVILVAQGNLLFFPFSVNKFFESEKMFKQAIKQDPNNYPSIIGLALFRYFAPILFGGSFSKSVELLERIIDSPRARPGHKYLAYVWLSQNWVKKKDFEKTKLYLDKAREIFPQGGLLFYADSLLKSKKRIGG